MASASLLKRIQSLEERARMNNPDRLLVLVGNFPDGRAQARHIGKGVEPVILDLNVLNDPSPLPGAPELPCMVSHRGVDEFLRDLVCGLFAPEDDGCDW